MAPEPATPETADLGALKALGNPLRQRILRHLSSDGPATSTTLARTLGVTTGGTSYNLRVLAQHGFVEEVPELAGGRKRWWRAVDRDLRMPVHSRQDAETRSAMEELHHLWFADDMEMFGRFQDVREQMGEWADALPYSRGSIRVTIQELGTFFEDYISLLKRYQRPEEEEPSDARTVLTHFMAFPAVGPDARDDHTTRDGTGQEKTTG